MRLSRPHRLGPNCFASIARIFLENSARSPDKPFVHLHLPGESRTVYFAEAWSEFSARAAELTASGASPGGIVLLFLPQGWDAIAYCFGAMLAGCIPSFMPLPSARQDPERYWASHHALLARIEPAAIITDAAHAPAVIASGLVGAARHLVVAGPPAAAATPHLPEPTVPEIALLQHSSGTTGLKKGVMLSHGAILRQVESYRHALAAHPDDVIVSWLPLYHDMGLIACLMMPAILGQTIVLLDPFHWVTRPGTLFEAIARYQGTLCWLPDFAFAHLARTVRPDPATMQLGSIRAFINCSEPCHPASFSRFHAAFAGLGVRQEMLRVCYAMAESVFAVAQTPPGELARRLVVDRRALEAQGRAVPGTPGEPHLELLAAGPPIAGATITVCDGQEREVPEGVVGEICVRAEFLFDGYHRDPATTAARLAGATYRTRDRGFLHAGEVFVLGRMDDLIILNGRKFHAAEIEGLMNRLASLKPGRNVAFGLFNDGKGLNELIVVAEPEHAAALDADGAALRHDIRAAIFDGAGIQPADILLVPPGWLVKTTSGKIARGANLEKYTQERAQRVAACA